MPFVDDFHHSLSHIRFIGKSASFFSPKPNLSLWPLCSDFKDLLLDNSTSVALFEMVGSRTFGRSVCRDGGPQNGSWRRGGRVNTRAADDSRGTGAEADPLLGIRHRSP